MKICMIGDFACDSGFARVNHALAAEFQELGHEISALGINFNGLPNQWSQRFKVYPAERGGDQLGVFLTREFLAREKPDILFILQDIWHILKYMPEIDPKLPLVAYFPIDSPNIKPDYVVPVSRCDKLVAYTHFGLGEVKKSLRFAYETTLKQTGLAPEELYGRNMVFKAEHNGRWLEHGVPFWQLENKVLSDGSFAVIPHGLDPKFKPVDKYVARRDLGIPEDAFVVGNVNMNRPRKRLDLTMMAFRELLIYAGYKKPKLLLHCQKNDFWGWDLPQLADYLGITGNVIYVHDSLEGATATDDELCLIYSAMDVQINTSGGEGWGLTSFEGAACGTPQLVPGWSATKEIWHDKCHLEVKGTRVEPPINTVHCEIDPEWAGVRLFELMREPELLGELVVATQNSIDNRDYSWKSIGQKFNEIFKELHG